MTRADEGVLPEHLLYRGSYLALGRSVVAGRSGLKGEHFLKRLDDLVLDIIDYVAADAGGPLGCIHQDVHRAGRMTTRMLTADAGYDLLWSRELEVK